MTERGAVAAGLTGKTSDFLKVGVAAAGRGDLATVRAVLAQRPEWLRRVGSHGRTMLWEAAYRGRAPVVEHLLDEGADIHARGCHFTPLLVEISPYCAARFKRHDAVAELLLRRGAREDFHTAVFLGHAEAVREQLRRRPALAKVEVPQHDASVRVTALHYAVSAGHDHLVALLLAHGADPKPHSHWLARFCVWRGRADILERLFAAGLVAAAVEPPRGGVLDPAVARVLKRHGVHTDVDHAEGGWPPIVFQCRGDRGGNIERVRALIAAGSDLGARNHKGQTALHCAAKAGFVDIVALLLRSGAEVDAQDQAGQTPLAATLRSTVKDKDRLKAVVRRLTAAGASPTAADAQGRTPLAIASAKRNGEEWLDAMDRAKERG